MSEVTLTEDLTQPHSLPVGLTEFHEWSDSIIEHSGLPNNLSTKNTLAHSITQVPHDVAKVPKQYFIDCLRKFAANQIAFAIKQEFAVKKAAELEAAKKEASNALSPSSEAVAATNPAAVG